MDPAPPDTGPQPPPTPTTMSTTHFRHVCEVHGDVLAQCRCPGPKHNENKPCPGPPICPGPEPRVFTTLQAGARLRLLAMHTVAQAMIEAALDSRLTLLRLGIGADHEACEQLDRTAVEYATARNALRVHLNPPKGDHHAEDPHPSPESSSDPSRPTAAP